MFGEFFIEKIFFFFKKMPISTTPPTDTHPNEFLAESNIDDFNFDQLLNDITKAEDALNELDGRLNNFNAKIDAMLLSSDSSQKKSCENNALPNANENLDKSEKSDPENK
ncbi:hypothetical protein C2G38_2191119 [Gigaspora rosea]|uniref:Uncharacterized protein n=1 Tax=Gigaspora rosea TaxID=44941 RepID=A0A397V4Z9_9GLOM|nr:hypothetical protein C2G38_2191119 [Gigaspora rosea]